MLSTDHIVLSGKRMRLVAMQQRAGTPAVKEEFSTLPIDAEGNNVMHEEGQEASAESRLLKKEVRCSDAVVTVSHSRERGC
jgi:hypothetical protein